MTAVMLVYCGIDEAGYGPMLGPLVVAATTLVLPDRAPEAGPPALWSELRRVVVREPARRDSRGGPRIVVNDSKRLKLAADGKRHPLHHLELGVITFTLARRLLEQNADDVPGVGAPTAANTPDVVVATRLFRDLELLSLLDPGVVDQMARCGWYAGADLDVPIAGHDPGMVRILSGRLGRCLIDCGVRGVHLDAEIVTEPRYNALVERMRSKSAASFLFVMRLVERVRQRFPDAHPRIIIDRQGARSYYREPLAASFPDCEVRIVAESDALSRYTLVERGAGGRPLMTISFIESAEEKHFPVALASMTAKYARELMMIRFNRWAESICPGIRHTAGYVQDARRFLDEFRDAAARARVDLTPLIRTR